MAENDPPPGRDVHDALNEPATDPDPTEWPDPYDKRPDPRDPAADVAPAVSPAAAQHTQWSTYR